MGGANPVKLVKSAAKSVANVATLGLYGAATTHSGNFLENMGKSFGGAVTGIDYAKDAVGEAGKVIGNISGATAAQEGLQAQIKQSQAEARRQALLSDEMARNADQESARVSLNTGKNRKGAGSTATGISGTSSSNATGIQS